MEQPPTDFHSQDAGKNEGQPKVNSDFYINHHNSSFGCNSLSSLSAGYTTISKFAGEKIGGLEISRDENDDGLEVDVESFHSVPVHLIHPDSESNSTEDRSSMSSLTNELTPSLNKNNKSSLFSKHLRQIQRSSRAQFLVEGIADAFDGQDQTSDVYCPRNGVYSWYSAQPNQFDPNNNHSSDKNTPPSQHEVSMSTYEKDFITSQEHINKLVRSPPGLSAHHNTPQLALNNSPQTTRQSGNSFLTYVYGRYSDCPRKKRIALLLFLIALFGGCIGLIVVTAGGKKDNLPANTNEKLVGLEDVAYEGGQLSLQEALPEGFSDEEAYLRDGSDGMNNTDSLSNTPSSSPSTKEPATSKPSPSPTTLAPSRQPSLAPTPVSTPLPSQRPDKPPPSGFPTQKPSRQPSQSPTSKPSRRPSQQPSMKPTRRPTPRPTPRPTLITLRPSTETPTRRPTNMPSPKPSSPPSKEPSKSPTQKPTTLAPSKTPTPEPSTAAPSVEPTSPPSAVPTNPPSTSPTDLPTTLPPSSLPSLSPTWPKSLSPSVTPTVKPTTTAPSSSPTVQPVTSEPSRSPTSNPVTLEPSSAPSSPPTSSPLTTPPSKAPTPDPSTLVPPTMTMLTPTPTAAPTKVTTPSLVPNHTNEPTATASITSTHTLFPTYAPTVA